MTHEDSIVSFNALFRLHYERQCKTEKIHKVIQKGQY